MTRGTRCADCGRPFIRGEASPGNGRCAACENIHRISNRGKVLASDTVNIWAYNAAIDAVTCGRCDKFNAQTIWDNATGRCVTAVANGFAGGRVQELQIRMHSLTPVCHVCRRDAAQAKRKNEVGSKNFAVVICPGTHLLDRVTENGMADEYLQQEQEAMEFLLAEHDATPLPKPVEYQPGTEEKVAALAKRVALGQHLFSEEDAVVGQLTRKRQAGREGTSEVTVPRLREVMPSWSTV